MTSPSLLLIAETREPDDTVGNSLRRLAGEHHRIMAMTRAEAIAFLSSCPPQELPRLVLIAPDADPHQGIATADAIRAIERSALLPIVLMERVAGNADVREAAARRVNSCIRAESDTERLNHDLDQLTRYWLDLNIPPPPPPGSAPA